MDNLEMALCLVIVGLGIMALIYLIAEFYDYMTKGKRDIDTPFK